MVYTFQLLRSNWSSHIYPKYKFTGTPTTFDPPSFVENQNREGGAAEKRHKSLAWLSNPAATSPPPMLWAATSCLPAYRTGMLTITWCLSWKEWLNAGPSNLPNQSYTIPVPDTDQLHFLYGYIVFVCQSGSGCRYFVYVPNYSLYTISLLGFAWPL